MHNPNTVVFCTVLALAVPGSAFADVVVTQTPCGSPVCYTFNGDTNINNWHRTLSFRSPGKGTAVVSVNGAMQCFNADDTNSHAMSIRSQIVRNHEAVADLTDPAPGRVLIVGVVPPGASHSMNLASKRLFSIPAVQTTHFRLRMRRDYQARQIQCYVYDVALTVHFVQ